MASLPSVGSWIMDSPKLNGGASSSCSELVPGDSMKGNSKLDILLIYCLTQNIMLCTSVEF